MQQFEKGKDRLQKGLRILFILSAAIIGAGFILEIINLSDYTSTLFFNNTVALSITLIASVLYILNNKNLKLSYTLIIYTALANILFGTFANEFDELRLNFLLRDSLFVMIFLSLAALVIHKRHALIIAAIYLIAVIAITLISDNFFMKNSILLIIVGVGGYGLMIRYFVGVLDTTIRELEENSMLIKKQSTLLEVNNTELVELNKTKDKFISILAHDLRNPLNTILGFSNILAERFDNLPDDKKKFYMQNILLTTEKTYLLLNTLLDWARSQSGTIAYKPENINPSDLLEENLDLLYESAKNKEVSLKKKLTAKDSVFVDKNMVNTIIRNLISNAIKFTEKDGTITASSYNKDDDVVIEISDNGVGMSKEDLENLFSIDRTKSRKGTANETGSGLGLLLCKEFVEKCGGEITVKSELNKGSSFSVSFPRVDLS